MFQIKRTNSKRLTILGGLVLFFCLISHSAIAADTTPPTGSIKINNGANYTNTINVTLNLSATDTGSGLSQMKFSNNNSTWSTPEAFATTKSWILSSGSGTRKVYVKFKDNSGNWSATYSDSISLPNQAPQVGTINPASGTSIPNQAVNFTTTYSDSNGWQDIQYVYFLVNTSTSQTKCLFGYYNQNTNKLYLRNDANTAWLGGFAPGSANIIQNSYAKLDCSKTTLSGSATTLTVNWSIIFKSSFLGTKNMYLYVKDDANAYNGWINKGTLTIQTQPTDNIPPTGSIKINSDNQYTNSTSVMLALSAQDNTGGSGLSQMQFSNDGSTWLTAEAYATTKSWTLTSGDGTKTVYVKYKDVAGNWSTSVSDTIILDNTPLQVGTITPSSGTSYSNQVITFTTTYLDSSNWQSLQWGLLLINTAVNGTNCFYGYYNQNENKLYLRNDSHTAWLGGYAPGSANVIENSYVKLDCSKTTVSGSGTTLTITWNITFKSTFTGVKNTYLYARDDANVDSGWIQKGDFCVFRAPISPP